MRDSIEWHTVTGPEFVAALRRHSKRILYCHLRGTAGMITVYPHTRSWKDLIEDIEWKENHRTHLEITYGLDEDRISLFLYLVCEISVP